MSELYSILKSENTYYDRKNFTSLEEYTAALDVSTTVYVGNLSFYTTQDSIRQLFSLAGRVTDIIMGIDNDGHPCGFCFVVQQEYLPRFESHEEASNAVEFISKTKLNDRIIRVDWDPGYKEGRQKGRGTGGQQRRDDFRTKEDSERPKKKPAYYENRERDRFDRYDRQDRSQRDRTRERHDYGDRERDYRRRDRQQERPRPRQVKQVKQAHPPHKQQGY